MWIRLFIECVNSQLLNDFMTPSPDVTIIDSDMREWTPPEKADILVSELLGNPPLLTSLLHIMYIHYYILIWQIFPRLWKGVGEGGCWMM